MFIIATPKVPRRGRIAAVLLASVLLPVLLAGQPAELLQRPRQSERSRCYDAVHYKLQFVFDVGNRTFHGENTITLLPLAGGFDRCALDAEDFTVTDVTGPRGDALRFEQTGKELRVAFPEAYGRGEEVTFTVRFFRKDPQTGLKFIPASPGRPAQINTYSWPEDAHHWFPCFDYPNDKVTNEMIVTVPSGYKVLSNGRLVESAEDPRTGTATFHWSQDRPHPAYGIMLAAGPYEIIRDSCGKIPVDYWVYPHNVPDAPRSFHKTPRMIEFYEKTFGLPYPWAKYDQVCVAGYGGGMEATTATILGDDTIHDARAEADFPSDGLVAHELAHMWWGDFVTPRTWADVWLSESFATYAEYLFSRFDGGEDEGALNLEEKKSSYLEEARTRYIRPVVFDRYEQPWQIMDGHSYPKGASILHMLRFVMGDDAFFAALRHFLEKFAFGIADTHDLMIAIKESSGMNLDWFFEQWIYSPGHPVFEVRPDWDESAGILKIKIDQVQDFSRGIPVFRTPVVLGFTTASTRRSERVWIRGKTEEFEFPCAARPLLVTFDEGNHLLKEMIFAKTAHELAFELTNGDVIGRTRAAREIGRLAEDPTTVPALSESAKKDSCWAVRTSAVEALGHLKGAPAAEAVLDRFCDPDSRVRAAAVRAFSLAGGPGSVSRFKVLFRNDPSYVVQTAALAAIGLRGGIKDIPFLRKASALRSPRDIVKRSALRAEGDIRNRRKSP
jgi:aminopeptidase N